MIDTSKVKDLSKYEQFRLMNAIRPFIPAKITQAQIAREADVTQGLVNHVFSGLNSNEEVVRVIFENLNAGWQNAIPEDLKHLISIPA
jgi:hypothetical protein